jgi:hypothetical protein
MAMTNAPTPTSTPAGKTRQRYEKGVKTASTKPGVAVAHGVVRGYVKQDVECHEGEET